MLDTYLLISGKKFHTFPIIIIIMEILEICIHNSLYFHLQRCALLKGENTKPERVNSTVSNQRLIMKIKIVFLHILKMYIYHFHS